MKIQNFKTTVNPFSGNAIKDINTYSGGVSFPIETGKYIGKQVKDECRFIFEKKEQKSMKCPIFEL